MLPIMAFALLTAAQTSADDFADRVTRARLAETAADGPAYQKAFWDKTGNPMTDAGKACLKSSPQADRSPFTLVAAISADGHPKRVEVRPPTPVAQCMANQFRTWTFPVPPRHSGDYPIEIDVTLP
ncbi:MAG TPA: peptidase C13 [Dyella sp.]|uniref:peptidase C13 n=1 Tax=Dyella sp. TaxID=1869338 RepID=UPI002F921CF7